MRACSPSCRQARAAYSVKTTPPLWTGRFSVFAGLEFPTRNGRSKAKRPVRHRFAPIRLKSTFEALRREGSDFTDLQFALAGYVCATRTLNAVRVRRPGKSERLAHRDRKRHETLSVAIIVQLHLICPR